MRAALQAAIVSVRGSRRHRLPTIVSMRGSRKQRQRWFLNLEERGHVIEAAGRAAPEVRTLCLTLIHTGCRFNEALALRRGDVLDDSGMIAFRHAPGAPVSRLVPVPAELLAALAEVHPADRPCARLWPRRRAVARQAVRAVLVNAGVSADALCICGVRAGFVINAYKAKVPENLVRRWLGLAPLAVFKTIGHLDVAQERAIAAHMW